MYCILQLTLLFISFIIIKLLYVFGVQIRLYSHFAQRFCSKILLLRNSLYTQPSERCSHVIETEQFKHSRNTQQGVNRREETSTISRIIKMAGKKMILIDQRKKQNFYLKIFTFPASLFRSSCSHFAKYITKSFRSTFLSGAELFQFVLWIASALWTYQHIRNKNRFGTACFRKV